MTKVVYAIMESSDGIPTYMDVAITAEQAREQLLKFFKNGYCYPVSGDKLTEEQLHLPDGDGARLSLFDHPTDDTNAVRCWRVAIDP